MYSKSLVYSLEQIKFGVFSLDRVSITNRYFDSGSRRLSDEHLHFMRWLLFYVK